MRALCKHPTKNCCHLNQMQLGWLQVVRKNACSQLDQEIYLLVPVQEVFLKQKKAAPGCVKRIAQGTAGQADICGEALQMVHLFWHWIRG